MFVAGCPGELLLNTRCSTYETNHDRRQVGPGTPIHYYVLDSDVARWVSSPQTARGEVQPIELSEVQRAGLGERLGHALGHTLSHPLRGDLGHGPTHPLREVLFR